MFIEASIFNQFDPKRHIRIKTHGFGYVIGRILSQLILDNLGGWYPVTFFSKNMILAETWYETHDSKLLIFLEVFKTWKHYLEGYKHEFLMLTDQNNLQRFIDTKNLSFR